MNTIWGFDDVCQVDESNEHETKSVATADYVPKVFEPVLPLFYLLAAGP